MSSAITHGLQHKLVRTTISKGLAPRQFKFVISSESLDRDKDIIKLSGWNLREYQHNPVVLASHAHQRLPVGRSVGIGVRGGSLRAVVEFPPKGISSDADQVHDLVDLGFLKAASVGFRADEAEPNGLGGMTIKKATLLEWSICSIGSNPDAMVERAAPAVMQKWLTGGTWPQKKEASMYRTLDDVVARQLAALFEDQIIDKEPDDFAAMCARMLAAYSEMDSEKFRELMARQLALLGPAASIADLLRSLTDAGVVEPKHWTDDDELIDVDDNALATAIAQVVAEEIGASTRSALNAALGRLD